MIVIASGLFTCLCTIIGASVVFFIKKENKKLLHFLMAFASGVMIAGAFFSLLSPAIDQSIENNQIPALMLGIGFTLGYLFIIWSEKFTPDFEKNMSFSPSKVSLSITLHNIPEGMCIGVAFALISTYSYSALAPAIALAIGIGIQNIPEGASVSMPIYALTGSKKRGFFSGALSGIVEPIGAVFAYLLSVFLVPILPILLSFGAACMLCVCCSDLLPESVSISKKVGNYGVLIGFLLMMTLDLLL